MRKDVLAAINITVTRIVVSPNTLVQIDLIFSSSFIPFATHLITYDLF